MERGFRRAAENGTPAACAPRAAARRAKPTSEFGYNTSASGSTTTDAVNWTQTQGGTNVGTSYSWWKQDGILGSDSLSTSTLAFPAPPGAGTQHVLTRWGSRTYDYLLDAYVWANTYSTNDYTGLSQPYYPWVHLDYTNSWNYPSDTNNPTFRLDWGSTNVETATAQIELVTGGVPGSFNQMFYSLWVYASDYFSG